MMSYDEMAAECARLRMVNSELVAALNAIVGAAWEEEYSSGYVICASAMKEASAALAKAKQVR